MEGEKHGQKEHNKQIEVSNLVSKILKILYLFFGIGELLHPPLPCLGSFQVLHQSIWGDGGLVGQRIAPFSSQGTTP